jgi:hypothetical protein
MDCGARGGRKVVTLELCESRKEPLIIRVYKPFPPHWHHTCDEYLSVLMARGFLDGKPGAGWRVRTWLPVVLPQGRGACRVRRSRDSPWFSIRPSPPPMLGARRAFNAAARRPPREGRGRRFEPRHAQAATRNHRRRRIVIPSADLCARSFPTARCSGLAGVLMDSPASRTQMRAYPVSDEHSVSAKSQ